METPDKWLLIDVGEGVHKVFASWTGGYLDGDYWRLNSGIERVEKDGDYFLFHGFSGSTYKCHKDAYGATGYGSALLYGNNLNALSDYKEYVEEALKQ